MHSTAASRWHLLHLQHPLLAGLQSTTLASRCWLAGALMWYVRCLGGPRTQSLQRNYWHVIGCRARRQRLEPQAKTRSEAADVCVSSHPSHLWSASTISHAGLRPQMAPLCRNAEALGNALLVCMIFPWFLCFVFYTGALG
jgi:hypothetical protein